MLENSSMAFSRQAERANQHRPFCALTRDLEEAADLSPRRNQCYPRIQILRPYRKRRRYVPKRWLNGAHDVGSYLTCRCCLRNHDAACWLPPNPVSTEICLWNNGLSGLALPEQDKPFLVCDSGAGSYQCNVRFPCQPHIVGWHSKVAHAQNGWFTFGCLLKQPPKATFFQKRALKRKP